MILRIFIILALTFTSVFPLNAQADGLIGLPEPGKLVQFSLNAQPALIKGLKVYANNPLLFDFIVDR